jgi:hypothetical protein
MEVLALKKRVIVSGLAKPAQFGRSVQTIRNMPPPFAQVPDAD